MKYPYLVAALILVFGTIDIAIVGNKAGLDASGWAAWVQAIGSVAALGVAIYVMSRQNSHAARLIATSDQRAARQRTAAVTALVERAHEQIANAVQILPKAFASTPAAFKNTLMVVRKYFVEMQVALKSIPAHELGSYGMVIGIHKTIEAFGNFEHLAASWDAREGTVSEFDVVSAAFHLNEWSNAAIAAYTAGAAEFQ